MSEAPWLTIIGLGEDGLDGLPPASRSALESAEIVMGPPRHLALVGETTGEQIEWPVPFSDGLEVLKGYQGRNVVVLASGDPFWFGAGSVIARKFGPEHWKAIPGTSTFSLAAAHLGWPIEQTTCLGLHAAPISRIRPKLADGNRAIVLLRDGDSVKDLTAILDASGFGESTIWVMESLGGAQEKVTQFQSNKVNGSFKYPVCVAIEMKGIGLPKSSGLPDENFETDGVMTKRPIRAITLSALAPRPGEQLLDIGGGSGSVAIEWLLAHSTCRATTIEPRADRIALIRANMDRFGVDDLEIVEGSAPEAFAQLSTRPDAIFVGGGLSENLLEQLETHFDAGTRVVINCVTLEAEALLVAWQSRKGGELMRVEISETKPLGAKRGWSAAYPVVQWAGQL